MSLKVEGYLANTNSYCYGWDFLRFNIRRVLQGPKEQCQVTSDVSCMVDTIPCDEIPTIPIDTCEDVNVNLTFQYCNKESSHKHKVSNNKIEMLEICKDFCNFEEF